MENEKAIYYSWKYLVEIFGILAIAIYTAIEGVYIGTFLFLLFFLIIIFKEYSNLLHLFRHEPQIVLNS